jgi:hypothetical protein
MDNAQKAIMIGVGLFITIIIIAAVMLITGMGQNLLNKGQAQVEGISESLMNDLTAQYDGKKMSGSQVRTAAVQLVNREDASITVRIINGADTKDQPEIAYNSSENKENKINDALRGNITAKYTGVVKSTSTKGVVVAFVKNGVTYNITDY